MTAPTFEDSAWYWVEKEGWIGDPPTIAPALYKAQSDAWYSFAFSGIPTREVKVLEPCRRAPAVTDTRARYSGSIQELKQYASEDVDAMVHICNKHIGNVPKGFFLAMQECAALVGRAPAVPQVTPEMVAAAEDAYMPFGDMELAIQCALSAAPQPPEADHIPDAGKMVAAPVQMPEPVAVMTDTTPREPGWKTMFVPDSGTRLYTEQQVRQLLANHGIQEQST